MGKDVKIGLSVLALLFGLLGYVCYQKFRSPSVHSPEALAQLREKLAKEAGGDSTAQAGREGVAANSAAHGQPLDAAAAVANSSAWNSAPADGAVDPVQYTAAGEESSAVAPAAGDQDPGAASAWTIDDEPAADGAAPDAFTAPGDASPFGAPHQFAGTAGEEPVPSAADQPAGEVPYEAEPTTEAQGAALASEAFAPAQWQDSELVEPSGQPDRQVLPGEEAFADEPAIEDPAADQAHERSPLKFDDGDGPPPAETADTAADASLQPTQQSPQALSADVNQPNADVRWTGGRRRASAASSAPQPFRRPTDEPATAQVMPREQPETTGELPTAFDSQSHAAAAEPYAPAGGTSGRTQQRDEYVVQPNDNYWTISKQLYGTGAYFKALYELNRKQFPRADRLKTGDVILAPSVEVLAHRFPDLCPTPKHHQALAQERAATRAVSQRGVPAGARVYVVEEGDTLFDIARYELGKATRWVEIYDLNRDVLGEDIDYLRPGTQLMLPHAAGQAEEADAITQRPGDAYRR